VFCEGQEGSRSSRAVHTEQFLSASIQERGVPNVGPIKWNAMSTWQNDSHSGTLTTKEKQRESRYIFPKYLHLYVRFEVFTAVTFL
jgi:hypothetical protein